MNSPLIRICTRLSLLRIGAYLPKRTAWQKQQQCPRWVWCPAELIAAHQHCNYSRHISAATAADALTIKWGTLQGAIRLLHHHDVNCTCHVGCQAIHSAQNGSATHHYRALQHQNRILASVSCWWYSSMQLLPQRVQCITLSAIAAAFAVLLVPVLVLLLIVRTEVEPKRALDCNRPNQLHALVHSSNN